jgi:hypothetical protein
MKIKIPWLTSLLLCAVLLTLTNCQNEFEEKGITMDESQQSSKEILTGQRANEKVEELIKVLKKSQNSAVSNGMANRTKMVDIENYIDYTEVFQIKQTNGITNYTYRVSMPDATDKSFYNIVMKTFNGAYKTVLIKYDMDATFAKDYIGGKTGFEKFTGTMNFEIIDIDPGFPCDDDVEGSMPVSGGGGGGGNNGGGAGNPVDLSGGAANGGPTHGGSTYSQAIVDAKFLALQLLVLEEQWLEVHRSPRYFRMPQTTVEPGNPCGDGEEIGILEPGITSDARLFEELKKLGTNSKIKASYNNLALKTNLKRESGYGFSDNSDPVALQLLPGYDNMIQIKFGGLFYGDSHTHPNPETTEYTPMFSLSDIVSLLIIRNKYEGEASDDAKFVFTLTVNNNGNVQTFAVKIKNYSKFRLSVLQKYVSKTNSEKQDLANKLNRKYLKVKDSSDHSTTAYLKQLMIFLNETGIEGIDIFKSDENLTDWTKFTYNSETNTINEMPFGPF